MEGGAPQEWVFDPLPRWTAAPEGVSIYTDFLKSTFSGYN